MTLELLKKMILSEESYFIVAKKNYKREHYTTVRQKDTILLVLLPSNIPNYSSSKDILLHDVETLSETYADCNIILNEPYPPFQIGEKFSEFYKGFKLSNFDRDTNFNSFLIKLLQLNSHNIHNYHKLAIDHGYSNEKCI